MPLNFLSRRLTPLLLALALCACAPGCVRRRLTLRTFPPGAQVFVDDQEIGVTPCSTPFVYYGTRKMTLIKDGYKTETLYQKFDPPWYEYPPLDFIAENLIVRELRDERVVEVQLAPQEIVAPNVLLQRAEGLRTSSRTGQVTSLPNLPLGAVPLSTQPSAKIGLPGEGLPGYEPQPYFPLPGSPSSSLPPGSSTRQQQLFTPSTLPYPGTIGEPIPPGRVLP